MTVTAATMPAGAVDRTPPNSGLTIIFTTDHGAAYRCLACNAGTGVGAYGLKETRVAARMHRADSCPHPDAHHVTRTGMGRQPLGFTILGRRRQPPRGTATYPVASCTCGWSALGEDGDRESGRRLARSHRQSAHEAWLQRAVGP